MNHSPLRIITQVVVTIGTEKKSALIPVRAIPRFAGNTIAYFEEAGSSTRKYRLWEVLGFSTPGQDVMRTARSFYEKFVAWQDKRAEAEAKDKRQEWIAPAVYIESFEKPEDMLEPKGHSMKARESEFIRDRTDGADWQERAVGSGYWNKDWDTGRWIKLAGAVSPLKRQTWNLGTPSKYPLPSILAALAMTRYSKGYLMEKWGKAWNRKAVCTILRECEAAVAQAGSGHRDNWNEALEAAAYRLVLRLESLDFGSFSFKGWMAWIGQRPIKYEGLWGKEEGMTEDLCLILHTCTMAFIKAIYKRRAELFSCVEEEKAQLGLSMTDDFLSRMAEKIVIGDRLAAVKA